MGSGSGRLLGAAGATTAARTAAMSAGTARPTTTGTAASTGPAGATTARSTRSTTAGTAAATGPAGSASAAAGAASTGTATAITAEHHLRALVDDVALLHFLFEELALFHVLHGAEVVQEVRLGAHATRRVLVRLVPFRKKLASLCLKTHRALAFLWRFVLGRATSRDIADDDRSATFANRYAGIIHSGEGKGKTGLTRAEN